MPEIRLSKITKSYGSKVVLKDLDLHVRSGELMVILGPTGCGKTTLLNVVAGLERQDSGDIYFDDRLVNDLPPEKRRIGLVFQDYALFPHMKVFENVAYGLNARGVPLDEVGRRVDEGLVLLGIEALRDKHPGSLSGGEQQRVSLARALVIEPDVLLLDEPFSNLDARVREQLRIEIRGLQKRLGITTIHVTHDQSEAFIMADRIAVMGNRRLEQVGTPEEIFYRPDTEYVAWFVGIENVFRGRVSSTNVEMGTMSVDVDGLEITIPWREKLNQGDRVKLFIRPEDVFVMLRRQRTSARNIFRGRVSSIVSLRGVARLKIALESGGEISVDVTRSSVRELNLEVGREVFVAFKATSIHVIRED